jgi:hypothetical protein
MHNGERATLGHRYTNPVGKPGLANGGNRERTKGARRRWSLTLGLLRNGGHSEGYHRKAHYQIAAHQLLLGADCPDGMKTSVTRFFGVRYVVATARS